MDRRACDQFLHRRQGGKDRPPVRGQLSSGQPINTRECAIHSKLGKWIRGPAWSRADG